ncbi:MULTISPECIES: hypothetical protein [unclassified Paenibacillus]|uniref:hypothetical protein n=1 Tax=unclassified Paenibacillus TaxID=185978 RepID=UPI0009A7A3F3|nr:MULTISPECIES: hypothetical protein [unclassified Paenibacillus]SLJ92763.1 hypothetical protein SAMN06272722_1011142 [Paenibacillus sp. RU5A]SOC58506.1 hypothetical protein SAMN05880581_10148 [Paenibacillus sp. RU26A]SOC67558.1 hypothetical protein SAMN05880586_10148 [Paenibacillus sp. RU5M]
MKLSLNEIALIAVLRTLDFCDMLDVFDSLEELSVQSELKGLAQTQKGDNPASAAGWLKRASDVEKLRDALCMANDDYRANIFPENQTQSEVLQ